MPPRPADAARARAVSACGPADAPSSPMDGRAPARRVHLAEEDSARVTWTVRRRTAAPAPPPLVFEVFLERARAWAREGGQRRGHERETLAPVIPTRLSKEEAWLWLQCLDTPAHGPRLDGRLREAHAAGPPEDTQVRAFAEALASRSGEGVYVGHDVPQTLQPFFTPLEIAGLIVREAQRRRREDEPSPPWQMLAFADTIVPALGGRERTALRIGLERACDAAPDGSSPETLLRLALLATVGGGRRLATHVAGLPDRAWEQATWNPVWHSGRAGYLDVLAGLADEATFVRETRRLGCLPRGLNDLRLWLAATQWRELDVALDAVRHVADEDRAAALTRILGLVEAPETAPAMLAAQRGASTTAIAAEWLASHPQLTVLGLVPTAMGRGALAQAAADHLLTCDFEDTYDHLPPSQVAWLQREIEAPRDDREAGTLELQMGEGNPPSWLSVASLPPIRVGDSRLGSAAVISLLNALSRRPTEKSYMPEDVLIRQLKPRATPSSLDAFSWRLFELWRTQGGIERRDRWVLTALNRLGGDGCVEELSALLRSWRRQVRSPLMPLCVKCLGTMGSATALTALSRLAIRGRPPDLREQAQEVMREVTRARGLTAEQLADRIVSDGGLDARSSRVLDFGPRRFHVVVGPALQPLLRDAAGRILRNLPQPVWGDDPGKAFEALAAWRRLKRLLREVTIEQIPRLEEAMIDGRRWTPEEFEEVFLRHPLMIHLVRPLVLAAYDKAGVVTATFRIAEDRTVADQNDRQTSLPTDGMIGVVHPVQIDEATRSAWELMLCDYETVPPFPQLNRVTHVLDGQNMNSREITRYRKAPTSSGIALNDAGWYRHLLTPGLELSGTHVEHFARKDVTAVIQYTVGRTRRFRSIRFLKGPVDIEALPPINSCDLRIKEVDPVVVSETLRLTHIIGSLMKAD